MTWKISEDGLGIVDHAGKLLVQLPNVTTLSAEDWRRPDLIENHRLLQRICDCVSYCEGLPDELLAMRNVIADQPRANPMCTLM